MDENPLERMSQKMRVWMQTAGQKTGEVARVGRRQVELLQIEWDLFRRRAALGQCVSRLIDRGGLPDWTGEPELAALLDSVRALEREIREKRREIQEIHREAGATPTDRP